jgi:hypothetical protein
VRKIHWRVLCRYSNRNGRTRHCSSHSNRMALQHSLLQTTNSLKHRNACFVCAGLVRMQQLRSRYCCLVGVGRSPLCQQSKHLQVGEWLELYTASTNALLELVFMGSSYLELQMDAKIISLSYFLIPYGFEV